MTFHSCLYKFVITTATTFEFTTTRPVFTNIIFHSNYQEMQNPQQYFSGLTLWCISCRVLWKYIWTKPIHNSGYPKLYLTWLRTENESI